MKKKLTDCTVKELFDYCKVTECNECVIEGNNYWDCPIPLMSSTNIKEIEVKDSEVKE